MQMSHNLFITFLRDSLHVNPIALAYLFDFCADWQVRNSCNNFFSLNRCQELLVALHERHEEWLIQKKFPVPAPVMVSKNRLKNLKQGTV